jgi:hypothetical protein
MQGAQCSLRFVLPAGLLAVEVKRRSVRFATTISQFPLQKPCCHGPRHGWQKKFRRTDWQFCTDWTGNVSLL